MKVLRVYHCGRDAAHRRRERALVAAGVDLVLVVPATWPAPGSEEDLGAEPFEVVELPVSRAGDVNRHGYPDRAAVSEVLRRVRPDVLDVHEEPVSIAARQWLSAAGDVPAVLYTAQNLDKRFPPPFHSYERGALERATGLYPCSRQAASVARGKGFTGHIAVLPLGIDPGDFPPGAQQHDAEDWTMVLAGRMVPEKGVQDAVRALAAVHALRPAVLHLVGSGPELAVALRLAADLGVADRVRVEPWGGTAAVAASYRRAHVLLVPSRATATWVEQFGRVIVEAQASGCAVAGYRSGAIPEVAGDSAVLVDEGDVGALQQAVAGLALEREGWETRRRGGTELSARRSWQEVADAQRDLYQRVASGSPEPRPTAGGPAAARLRAREEFGQVARTPFSDRPFAVPLLRGSRILTLGAGRVLDALSGGGR